VGMGTGTTGTVGDGDELLSPCSSLRWTWVSRYPNVSILDFIGTKGDGGGDNNWS